MRHEFSQWLALGAFVAVCFTAAALGSMFTTPEIAGWYAHLNKPQWTPPNWVFGPVWSTLYLMMAVAAWLVWREHGLRGAVLPLALFAAQLLLNTLWSIIFFGLHRVGLAFFDIALLWGAILVTMMAFWRVVPLAGWLMLPYLLWVAYASALNFTIWRMNS